MPESSLETVHCPICGETSPLESWERIKATFRAVRRNPLLAIDTSEGTLQFAPTGIDPNGSAPIDLPVGAIDSIAVTEHTRGRRSRYRLDLPNGDDSPLTIAEYGNRENAEALADWLRQRARERSGIA
ncbi:MAG: hypothetical protein HY040_22190 [Planctomycetes bacterium]|nr:hypothetical protein [Planctomycetota bacterium]